jgi:hypothetical protein
VAAIKTGTFPKLPFLALGLAFIAAGCGDDITGSEEFMAERSFSVGYVVTTQSHFLAIGVFGNVVVKGSTNSGEIWIEGVRRVISPYDRQDASANLARFNNLILANQNQFSVITRLPSDLRGREYIIDYEITVPEGFAVTVSNVTGDVSISAVDNAVSVENFDGDVSLERIRGDITVELASGAIDAEVSLPVDGVVDLSTGNGNIDLAVPLSTSAEFYASAGNGMVSTGSLDVLDALGGDGTLFGTLGSGSGQITLATGNGDIALVASDLP